MAPTDTSTPPIHKINHGWSPNLAAKWEPADAVPFPYGLA